MVKRRRPFARLLGDEFFQARLEDRNLAGLEARDLGRVDIDANHVVADFGEAGTGDQADITGAENRDVHTKLPVDSSRQRAERAL